MKSELGMERHKFYEKSISVDQKQTSKAKRIDSIKVLVISTSAICFVLGIVICIWCIISHNSSKRIVASNDVVSGTITQTSEYVSVEHHKDDDSFSNFYSVTVYQNIEITYTYCENKYETTINGLDVFSKKYQSNIVPSDTVVLREAKNDLMEVYDKIELYVEKDNPDNARLKSIVDKKSKNEYVYISFGLAMFFFLSSGVVWFARRRK